ncbi:MAG: ATP-dependent DNA helicase [Gammaproteobacteria bacterium]|nr:ATP-dependent DNA helicase [Gammaproteobacteria bacterium]
MQELEDIFAADGPLADAIDGYTPRPVQQEMATAVSDALSSRARLLVEAGTGTGKTFAYLVPALLSGIRVIISTGTRNLQDQLFHKDMPELSRALGRPVKVAILKGRSNYLCHHRLSLTEDMKGKSGRHLQQIRAWALSTQSGDIAELSDLPEQSPVWPQVTSTSENCLGQECPVYASCFVVRARREAMDADIVIVNHHLLLADMALKEEGFGELLPGVDAVVVDEAHQLPKIAGQFFGLSVGSRQLEYIARDTRAELLAAVIHDAETENLLDGLPARLADLRLTLQKGRTDYENLDTNSELALQRLDDYLGQLISRLDEIAEKSPGLAQCFQRFLVSLERIETIRKSDEKGLRWLETGHRGFSLNLTPFDVSESLGRFVNTLDCGWIFTSATLAVGDDFSHLESRLGLEEAAALKLESPFDYQHNSMIFIPKGLPVPSDPQFTAQLVEACLPLIDACRGGVFFLFTSHRALREAEALLKERWGENPERPLLVQGQMPRNLLLQEFRRLGNAVLLGAASFWEGVDVRGPALGLVIIDKLPFASPADPLTRARIAAITESGGNAFSEHQLPEAVLALKQGVGRLIRSETDTGVVVLGDPRLQSKSYGKLFFRSLPDMPITQDVQQATELLAGGEAGA